MRIHAWGAANNVAFDPGKEQFKVLHRSDGVGEPFRLLGLTIDRKLIMEDAIERIVSKVRPKLRALLRSRRFNDDNDMFVQYKALILSVMEQDAGAYFHAALSHLRKLDRLQEYFLQEIGVSERAAFLVHNLAPLSLRRNIGFLGFLHKCAHGNQIECIRKLFPLVAP